MYLDEGEPVRVRVTSVDFADTTGGRLVPAFHGSALDQAHTGSRMAGGAPKQAEAVNDLRAMSITV
jgi:hypothetical protein